jgi:hypothetical protein
MVSDGIDRLRGEKPAPSRLGPNYGTVYQTIPTISVDTPSASEISQRYNVIVHQKLTDIRSHLQCVSLAGCGLRDVCSRHSYKSEP